MSTKPTFKVSGVLGEALKQMDKTAIEPYKNNKWDMGIPQPTKPTNPKMKSLLVPNGPPMDGAYIDVDGYPRFFDPFLQGEDDEFIAISPSGIHLCPKTHVYIMGEGQTLESLPSGMFGYEKPEIMKTKCVEMVKTIIERINGVKH